MAFETELREGEIFWYVPLWRKRGKASLSLTEAMIFLTGSPISRATTEPIMSPKLPLGMEKTIGSPGLARREAA